MKIETQGKNNVLQSCLFELCVNLYVSGVQIQPRVYDKSRPAASGPMVG